MAKKETLYLDVDSNIKSVTAEQKKFNQELKGTKKGLEDVNAEGKEIVAEMQFLGVSLNGVKAGFNTAASAAKFLFKSIKVGIISTGIGALLVAFASLATFLTQTKKGAEILERAFAGVGAAVRVITDRIANFGKGIGQVLSGKIFTGLTNMKNSFIGIGREIKGDTLLAIALTTQLQILTDSERNLNVETAKRRTEIEKLKLIAEDVTKSEEERVKAAKDAFKIENDILNQRTKNAEKAIEIQKSQNNLKKDEKEDLDALAEKEIALANIQGESFTKQIELNNKINAIQAEIKAKELARIEEQRLKNAEAAKQRIEELEKIRKKREETENTTKELALEVERLTATSAKNQALRDLEREKARKDAELKEIKDKKEHAKRKALIDEWYLGRQLEIASMATINVNENETLSAEIIARNNALQLTDAKEQAKALLKIDQDKYMASEEFLTLSEKAQNSIIKRFANEQVAMDKKFDDEKLDNELAAYSQLSGALSSLFGDNKELAAASAIIDTYAGANKAFALGGPVGFVTGAAIIAQGLNNVSKIYATDVGGSGGGGSTPAQATAAPPSPQMMAGGLFSLQGSTANQPVKAFVVSDDITNSQNSLALIRRRATI